MPFRTWIILGLGCALIVSVVSEACGVAAKIKRTSNGRAKPIREANTGGKAVSPVPHDSKHKPALSFGR